MQQKNMEQIMQNTTQSQKSNFISVTLILIAWIAYATLTSIFKQHEATKFVAGILATLGDTGLNLAIVAICIWLWRNAAKEAKLLFMFFSLSFAFVTIPNAVYHLIFNVFHIQAPYFDTTNNLILLHHIPYMFCLIFEFAAWMSVAVYLFSSHLKLKNYTPIIFVVSLMLLMFIWIYGWKFNFKEAAMFSKVYKIYITSFYIVNFTIAALCLAACRTRSIFYLALGYIIIVGTDLIMDFGFMSQGFGIGSLLDNVWFLGILFMLYGLLDFKKTKDYKLNPKHWVSEPNSIKTQIAFWCFALCASCLGVFLLANSILEPKGVFF